ncbi:MAG: RNA polymerase sigma-70 factor [Candidatus Cryptobacteroides sp.]
MHYGYAHSAGYRVMLINEREILISVSEGDRQAFGRLFSYYYPRVATFVGEIVNDSNAAEDIAQDIFAKLWLMKVSITGIRNFGSYLYVASRNSALLYLKKKCPSVNIDDIDFIVEASVDDRITADEKELAIRKAVANMPERRKEVFVKSRWEGKSNDEIASEMGISKKTVENMLNAALKEIRRILAVIVFFS